MPAGTTKPRATKGDDEAVRQLGPATSCRTDLVFLFRQSPKPQYRSEGTVRRGVKGLIVPAKTIRPSRSEVRAKSFASASVSKVVVRRGWRGLSRAPAITSTVTYQVWEGIVRPKQLQKVQPQPDEQNWGHRCLRHRSAPPSEIKLSGKSPLVVPKGQVASPTDPLAAFTLTSTVTVGTTWRSTGPNIAGKSLRA